MDKEKVKKLVEDLTKNATDEGKVIELGWLSLRALALSPEAPEEQVDQLRKSFFCGAHFLFSSIMTLLEPGTEPTELDRLRLDMIHRELKVFEKEMGH
jgi:hypothetical protein